MSASTEQEELYSRVDRSSQSNPQSVRVTHIDLQWALDFHTQTVSGRATHSLSLLQSTDLLLFDSSCHMHIEAVLIETETETERETAFKVESLPQTSGLGERVSVSVPAELSHEGSRFRVCFRYSISAAATAVQWLDAAATKGGARPFVFTQCQAIHARSLLPCMDSPAVKTTYTATVTAPSWCTVLMSALAVGSTTEGDVTTYKWNQPVPTPAYLIALAAGRLESRDVSDRVRIWAEPEVVEAAHYEFDETEEFLKTAEDITGCPYQWTRYDVLCLPPSFPYGGMENPCLTFATPTLLAGDKSLADVIAHEIAHSWTGNLVTNHTWDHFFLNEGWTVWLERKITSKYKKNDEVGILSAQIGYKHLQESVELLGEDNKFTRLVWPLQGEDPDEAFSSVPYEKGFNLLNQLETLVGRETFEAFAKVYIDTFKFGTVTTGEFRDCFVKFIGATAPEATVVSVDALDWNKLFLTTGMPEYVPCFKNSLSAVAERLANNWIERAVNDLELDCSIHEIQAWGSSQICLFLEAMMNYKNKDGSAYEFQVSVLEEMDSTYKLSERKNAEIKLRWHTLCLRSNAEWIVPYVTDFITSQGRMKFVRPLYRSLKMSKVGGHLAQALFDNNKEMYHPIARKMLEVDLTRLAALIAEEEEEEAEEESDEGETE